MKGDLWLYVRIKTEILYVRWYLYTNINIHSLIETVSYSCILERNFFLLFFNATFLSRAKTPRKL